MAKEKSGPKGKKKPRNKPTSQKYKHYKIEGEKASHGRFCPRCGPGVFLSDSSGRLYCGKCHYTSFDKAEIEAARR
jgi:small subunit ribosomal protein S27Ae